MYLMLESGNRNSLTMKFPLEEDGPEVSNEFFFLNEIIHNFLEYGFMGTIPFINRFDHQFFGIRKGHVNETDPQLCMALERTFEALLDAGT